MVGVDPQAPDGPEYSRVAFEKYDTGEPVDAVIASLSLHHVADPGAVLDRICGVLVAGGTLVVLEWAREHFDEATAQWCFSRLPTDDAEQEGALRLRRAEWAQSGLSWDRFCHEWAQVHEIPPAATIRRELDTRFTRTHESWGPYYFPESPPPTKPTNRPRSTRDRSTPVAFAMWDSERHSVTSLRDLACADYGRVLVGFVDSPNGKSPSQVLAGS